MRSYDSKGDVITFQIAEADYDKYPAGDLNVAIGDFTGITEGPVDTLDGMLNVAVSCVYNRTVTNAGAEDVSNVAVYLADDGSLTTDNAAGPEFGKMIGTVAAGDTADVRVRLNG